MEYTDKKENDLVKILAEKRSALKDFRFGVSGSKVRDVKAGKNLRKEIARILTEVNSRKSK